MADKKAIWPISERGAAIEETLTQNADRDKLNLARLELAKAKSQRRIAAKKKS